MIVKSKHDKAPEGYIVAKLIGDEIEYYFPGDDDADLIELNLLNESERVRRAEKKHSRELKNRNIVVTTKSGNEFNGDETSQQRMLRAIFILLDNETIDWTMANNAIVSVNKTELIEALRLAFKAQSDIWGID